VNAQTDKRDTLIATEKKYQQQWKQDNIFQADAPTLQDVPFHSITPAELREQQPKQFSTLAYPYMVLHDFAPVQGNLLIVPF
jgi:leucyl-tRNA synthetase